MLGNLISAVVIGSYAVWRGVQPAESLPHWRWLRGLGRAALAHHMLNLTLQAPGQLLPLIVTALLSAQVNAYFYAALMLASFIHIIPTSLATVLYAVGAGDRVHLAGRLRTTLTLSSVLAVGANICLWLGAEMILSVFGSAYASQTGWSLHLLGLTTLPLIVRGHAIAIYRLSDRMGEATLLSLLGGVLEIAFAVCGGWLGGLSGLCLGWLIAVTSEALVFAPVVVRSVFSERP